jgi:multiple sugar transport system permease protein
MDDKGTRTGRIFPTSVRIGAVLLFTLALALLLGFCLFPIVWQLLTALKPRAELMSLPPVFPSTLTLDHVRTVFAERPFARILLNSTVVALGTTTLCLIIGAPAAFALAKLSVPGRRPILLGILAVSMFPPIAVVGALFLRLYGIPSPGVRIPALGDARASDRRTADICLYLE